MRGPAAAVTREPGLLATAAALRTEVFVGEQGVDPALEQDGRDAAADHALATDAAGRVVATGRLLDEDPHGETGVVGRMAVAPAARGQGYGAAVLRGLEARAGERGLLAVDLHAQAHAAGFYRRLGYQVVGAPFVEAGIEHVLMRRDLLPGVRAVRDADAAAVQALIGGCFAEYPGCVLDLAGVDAWMTAPATAYAAKGGGLWVVPDGDRLRACGGWAPAAGGVELKSLYVAAPDRRQGLGTRLLRRVERQARALGAARVELWSDTRFADAHRRYAALGYERQLETRRLHDPSDTTEYRFVRVLGPP